MRENKSCPYQGWQQMSTEELDRILQAELEKEHPDEEVVLPILRTLEEREKDYPVEKTPEVLTILNKLSKHETSSTQSTYKRRWIAGVAALAAVVCLVVLAMPRAVGAESFLDAFFRWTCSVFEFFTPEQDITNPPVEVVFDTDNPGLQKLYDKMSELGVTEMVVPMWLPEGFVLSELKTFPGSSGNKVFCKFDNGSDAVLITYRISMDITGKVEKKETGVEMFEIGEVSHFIVNNADGLSATWKVDGVECLLNANIAKEDFYTIIKSIYRSELT